MKIRVLHIVHQLGVGGMENGVVNLVNRMDNTRFMPEIVTFVPGGKLRERVDTSRVKVIDDLNKRPGNDWRLPAQLAQIFRKERPHIIHTHAWGTLCESWLAFKLARVPVWIHGEHGTMQVKPLNKRIQRYLWGKADAVLAVSEVLADRLATTMDFPRERIRAIVNGVNVNQFRPNLVAAKSLRASLSISPDTQIIGIVGRLEPVKDHAVFLQAIAYVVARYPTVCALIIGDGALHSALEVQVEQLHLTSHVRFLGRRDDVPQLLNLMDVFVLSSRSEGMSNTILEAMACALPVVATNVGGNPELVVDGETGILVPPAPEELGKALLSLLNSPIDRVEMGKQGRRRVESLFSLERMVTNYEELYKSLCQTKGIS